MADVLDRAMGAKPAEQQVDPSEMARLFAESQQEGKDSFEASVAAMQDRVDAGLPRQGAEQQHQEGVNSFEASLESQQTQQEAVANIPKFSPRMAGKDRFGAALADWEVQQEQAAQQAVEQQNQAVEQQRQAAEQQRLAVEQAALQQQQAIEQQRQAAEQAHINNVREVIKNPRTPDEAQFIGQVKQEFSGARDVADLRERAQKMVGKDGYLVEDAENEWFKPAGGDLLSGIVMQELATKKNALEQEKKLDRLRKRVNSARQQRKEDKYLSAVEQAQQVQQGVKEEFDQHQEDLNEGKTYEDYLNEKRNEARRPFNEKIEKLKEKKEKLDKIKDESVREDAKKEVDKAIDELKEERRAAGKAAEQQVKAERKELAREVTKRGSDVMKLVEGTEPHAYVYEPRSSDDPDRSVAVSQSLGDLAGKRVEEKGRPFRTEQYNVGDTVMQRLVYRSDRSDVLIVEEWDKTAGILKKQTIMKGPDLLISDYENEGLGRIATWSRKRNETTHGLVLSKQKYEGYTKPITGADVAADSDTGYQTGRFQYSKRLMNTGVAPGRAYEMAAGSYRNKKTKGFLATLQDNLARGRN